MVPPSEVDKFASNSFWPFHLSPPNGAVRPQGQGDMLTCNACPLLSFKTMLQALGTLNFTAQMAPSPLPGSMWAFPQSIPLRANTSSVCVSPGLECSQGTEVCEREWTKLGCAGLTARKALRFVRRRWRRQEDTSQGLLFVFLPMPWLCYVLAWLDAHSGLPRSTSITEFSYLPRTCLPSLGILGTDLPSRENLTFKLPAERQTD